MNTPEQSSKYISKYILLSVIVIMAVRLLLTSLIPFMDRTESRYAEIARLMVETGEWVVLQIDYGMPFLAKPPLSTWLSALSFELFGINEMAGRLPSYLFNIGLLVILGNLVRSSKTSFFLPAFFLLTTPQFLLHTGVVSTDTAMSFSVALIMISFWKAITDGKSSFWNYLFFIALGLGILSKGFIVLPLTGLPILTWLLIHKVRIKKVLNALPWLIGIFIVAGITIPWFVLMEIRSPGFIDYFIIGEHFNRFLNAGWQGDLYGEGHSHPPGMIWVFLMLFAFPWIQIVLYKLWKERTSIIKDKWVSFLAIWLLWTPIFFTFSRNILHTYILPVMAPMALLMVCWWDNFKNKKYLILTGSVFPVLVVLALTAFVTNESLKSYINSDKYLLSKLSTVKSEFATPLYYYNEKSFSGQFYSGGYAQAVANPKELDSVMELNDPFNLVILKKYLDSIPASVKPHLHHLDSNYKISVFLVK